MRQSPSVAIVIPQIKNTLSTSEQLSLTHWEKYLSHYPTFTICPPGIVTQNQKMKSIILDAKHFQSVRSYSKLLLTSDFYTHFRDFEYILIYQLDALVFSDQLPFWCDQKLSYIGAPWFHSLIGLMSTRHWKLRGGNGGLSLRRIPDCIRVLEKVEASQYPFNEDGFWSFEASKIDPQFTAATFEQSLAFAFEENPRKCFKLNGGTLPFGAHAWQKYDQQFWIEKFPLLSL